MTIFCNGIFDAPAAYLLLVAGLAIMGMCIGLVTLRDTVKEIGCITAAMLFYICVLSKKLQVVACKDRSKTCGEHADRKLEKPQPIPESFEKSPQGTITSMAAPVNAEKPIAPAPNQESRQLSKRPVLPPTFTSTSFDDQVDELNKQLLPTEKCQRLVQEIANDVRNIVLDALPYADVVGFTTGEVSRGTAYGVAVPEVDIVVNLAPHILVRTLQAHVSKINFSGKVDDRRLNKSGLRMCTDLLVTSGGFKFRRSAFRGRDPKVTLMAPRSLDDVGSIPIDFSVNAATPLCNSVLVKACMRVDPRARMLILLVKRWAKDRGICHAAKGHLMPYAYTLLCIYFLQVGVKGGSILPPFKYLRLVPGEEAHENDGLAQCLKGWEAPEPDSDLANKRVGELFREFINFYAKEVDWSMEVVSIRHGTRSPPHKSLICNIETPAGKVVAPTIEDPFMPSDNLSELLSATGLTRFGQELIRAQVLVESGTPLSELLTQWVPPEERSRCEGSQSGDEATGTCVSECTVSPAPHKDDPSTLVPEQKEAPTPPWRKHKKQLVPPPGLWASDGKAPRPWPSPSPETSSAANNAAQTVRA